MKKDGKHFEKNNCLWSNMSSDFAILYVNDMQAQ